MFSMKFKKYRIKKLLFLKYEVVENKNWYSFSHYLIHFQLSSLLNIFSAFFSSLHFFTLMQYQKMMMVTNIAKIVNLQQ